MPDHFDNITDWLLAQSLRDEPIADTVKEMAARLVGCGIAISRISIGRSILHPVIGVIEMRWTRHRGQVTTRGHPRSYANIVEQMENPLIDLIKSNRDRPYSDLTDPDEVAL